MTPLRFSVLPILTAIGLFVCVGCQSSRPSASQENSASSESSTQTAPSTPAPAIPTNPEIELVKNGVLPEYNSTTVGKAFEGTFQNPKWSSFETPKGATIVEFDGTVLYKEIKSFAIEPTKDKDACIASLRLADTIADSWNKTLAYNGAFGWGSDEQERLLDIASPTHPSLPVKRANIFPRSRLRTRR